MAALAAAAALRALPGGASLDEPVVEYLTGAGGAHPGRVLSPTAHSAKSVPYQRSALLRSLRRAGALLDLADVREGGPDAAAGERA
jgi:hypothetical protein